MYKRHYKRLYKTIKYNRMNTDKLKLEIIQMILNISDEVLLKKIIAFIEKENQKS